MHGEGHTLADFSVSNDVEGADTLIQKVSRTAEKNQLHELKIGMESTDQYSWHLAHYLKKQLHRVLPHVQTAIYMLNARKVA
ncbi:hypothetical protein RhiirA1_487079, partial [Rhizophagus irregularis]